MSDTPFLPISGGTVSVSASTASAHAAIIEGHHWIRVVNPTNRVAHIKTSRGASLTATVADFPVPPTSGVSIIKISPTHNRVAVILASGATAGTVYITPGSPKN